MIKVIQFFACIDIILGTMLALPYVDVMVVEFMNTLVSSEPLLVDDYHSFLMKILGVTVILWGVIRVNHPELWQANYDCIARLFVIGFMAFYCYTGITILIFFIPVELLGMYQWIAQYRLKT